ncbi:polysaccharide deacetylase [Lachnotalea glycerini]|jgi:peptidoglycan/xylan/chitin deacetylase (PgdA/CDA1 family)|uniref:Polysaccharide deacetylase n=1 Tax=Lachnotalea glycerini TaxID=1763509 RepID=A0A318F2S1_9FIRM|nr:polysaccharide deacetylase family protein [Lachnotalea glycerini]PXV96168.1 polysaccharide deacetylase [Lachnotalea glycerini]
MSRLLKIIYTCFPEGKHKVLTMSYDDGREEDRRLVSLFNEYGIKGTFNLNAGIDWDEKRIPIQEYKELYQGHEIASHTYTHPTIERCPIEQVISQVIEDRKGLEKLAGYPVRGMAYPNGSYTKQIQDILPSLGIQYSRVVGNSDQFAMPRNYLEWKATCHHNHNLIELGQQFIDLFKTQYLYMMYVWGHSYEFTDRNNWEVIEEFCKLAGHRDDIWYATNIEIYDYMEAAGRLQYAADASFVYNPSAVSVWISVDDKLIEIPGGKQIEI